MIDLRSELILLGIDVLFLLGKPFIEPLLFLLLIGLLVQAIKHCMFRVLVLFPGLCICAI